jgi:Flp pilus assembly protein TadD
MPRKPADAADRLRDATARLEHGHALARLGQWPDAAARYREAVALAPDHATARLHLAEALTRTGGDAEALALLHGVVAQEPSLAEARLALGTALRTAGDAEAAVEEFRRAAYLAPRDPTARHNLGLALSDLDRLEEAVVWLGQAAQSGHLPALTALGTAHLNMGDAETALGCFRAALRAGDRSPLARLGEGLSLLTMGDLRAGWEGYESRPVGAPFHASGATQRWDGRQEIRGRTLLVWAEQGLGDSIMFARYLPLLRARGARVVLAAQEPLLALLAPLADDTVPEGATITFDMHCPLPGLPRAFGTGIASIPADIPYLHANPRHWPTDLGPGLNAGLVWAGNPDHARDRHRSLPFAAVQPLLALPGITWHILQPKLPDTVAQQVRPLPNIRLPGPAFADFADTAACVAALDLVVTADTSVAHLAGAMGKPVWLMLALSADFRWMRGRDDSPWYPTARLFRQTRRGDWATVVLQIEAALPRFRPTA